MGRSDARNGQPFRFILNPSAATVANVYLALYPKPPLAQALEHDRDLIRRIQEMLNKISPDQWRGQRRVYGGGLHKLEPSELAGVNAAAIAALVAGDQGRSGSRQFGLFDVYTHH